MASLEEQFEQAFTDIVFADSGKHLLEARAVTDCIVNGENVTIILHLPPDESLRKSISEQVEARVKTIEGINNVDIRMSDQPGNEDITGGSACQQMGQPGHHHSGHDHEGNGHSGHDHEGHDHSAPQQRPKQQIYLQNYDAVIAIASGKGGVGKSTVAVNLALTLSGMGHKVSLFDSDIYGPSVPIMMGLRSARTTAENEKIKPLQKYGLDLLSIGNLVEESAATIWRGPIVHQVITQLLRDTLWPGGDFMIIDLPPGTGDAQLTLSQSLEIKGAVIVSTPQDVALLDALKGVDMFNEVDIPVVGLVENMSTFICPKCDHETPIFDKGKAEAAASQHNIPFLGSIPIELAIREACDKGTPVAISKTDSPSKQAFKNIAENLIVELGKM